MSLNVSDFNKGTGGGGQFGSVPVGNHYGRLVQVVDKGVQERKPYQGKAKDPIQMLIFTYELPYARIEVDGVSKPRWISIVRNASMHKKALLPADLRVLDPDGSKGNLGNMINTPVLVNVVQKTDEAGNAMEGTKAENIAPVPAGMEIAPLENEPRIFDMANPDLAVFKQLPEWLRKDIGKALNYPGSLLEQQLTAAGLTPETAGNEATQGAAQAAPAQAPVQAPVAAPAPVPPAQAAPAPVAPQVPNPAAPVAPQVPNPAAPVAPQAAPAQPVVPQAQAAPQAPQPPAPQAAPVAPVASPGVAPAAPAAQGDGQTGQTAPPPAPQF